MAVALPLRTSTQVIMSEGRKAAEVQASATVDWNPLGDIFIK